MTIARLCDWNWFNIIKCYDPKKRMEDTFIPTRDEKHNYQRAVARFKIDSRISEHNKELILRFLRDAALGKTIIGRSKKRIQHSRLYKLLIILTTVTLHVHKNLDVLTDEDMELFIEALEQDRVCSRHRHANGSTSSQTGKPFSPSYKCDVKIIIRKFYKWLQGNNRIYPPIVEWIDTSFEEPEIPALTESEIERMIDRSKTPLQRALVQVFYDGGFRIGELINIRLSHVKLMEYDPHNPTQRCFLIRVPHSKTMRRTVALPMLATTKWLSLWLEDHPATPTFKGDGTLDAMDLSSQLFPMSANAIRLVIKRIGQKALNKRVYPHLLRHSSATRWTRENIPWAQYNKRFGWTLTSRMAQRYIDREGVDEVSIASQYHQNRVSKLLRERQRLLDQLVEVKQESSNPTPSRHSPRIRFSQNQH